MDTRTQAEPRLFIGGLAPFYQSAAPLSWLVIRLAVGWNLAIHGYGKIGRPLSELAPNYAAMGLEPGALWAVLSTGVEFAGGVAIMLGLFTRFFAAATAIELALITALYWSNGFSWLHRGYEYTLLWGALCFAIALRGGGPFSLDRAIGREL